MSTFNLNKQNDIEEGLIALPPAAPNAAGTPLSSSAQGLPRPPGHTEATLDGPPVASSYVAAMTPSLRNAPIPPELAAHLIEAAFDDDTAAKKKAGDFKVTEMKQTGHSHGPAPIPQASDVPAAVMPPLLRNAPIPPELEAHLIEAAFDDDTAAKLGDGGLKTTGLRQMQNQDGQPAFVLADGDDESAPLDSTEVEDGNAIDP